MRLETFAERFHYLALSGRVGDSTFGFDRYMNQKFYTSTQWRNVRYKVISRDLGRDLAVEGYEIHERPTIHHMNPITVSNLVDGDEEVLDPEYLITTTHQTHNAIHFGDQKLLRQPLVERRAGDTKLW